MSFSYRCVLTSLLCLFTSLLRDIFDYTVKLRDPVNKIKLGSRGRTSDRLTGITHREDRGAGNTNRETHRNE